MATEPPSDSSHTPAPAFQAPPPEGLPGKIFLSAGGLRAGWSLLLYGAFGLTISYVAEVFVHFIGFRFDTLSPGGLFLGEFIGFASAYGAAFPMALLERRPAGLYGLPLRQAFGKLFWQGVLLGLGEVTLLMGLIAALGGYSFGRLAVHGAGLLGWGMCWAVAFVFVGLSEEFLFRGYVQYTLARGIGFWPAAALLSFLFGTFHIRNPGEGIAGVTDVVLTGLVFAFALRRTGNLWLAVGWHASFDFGETFLYSVPNSGVLFDHHLSSAVLHGRTWLTGGTVGPEGSIFSFVTLGIAAVAIHLLFPAKKETSSGT